MKLAVLVIILIVSSACQTDTKVYSLGQQPSPHEVYTAELKWEEFGLQDNINCIYHVVDFDINEEGNTINHKLSDSSHDNLNEYSIAAIQAWKYNQNTQKRKARAAFVYTKGNDLGVYLLDPSIPNAKKENTVVKPMINNLERVSKVIPQLPRKARMKKINGEVILSFNVNPNGSVSDIELLKANPQKVFDKASIDAVKQWKYKPIDKITRQEVKLSYKFEDSSSMADFCSF